MVNPLPPASLLWHSKQKFEPELVSVASPTRET